MSEYRVLTLKALALDGEEELQLQVLQQSTNMLSVYVDSVMDYLKSAEKVPVTLRQSIVATTKQIQAVGPCIDEPTTQRALVWMDLDEQLEDLQQRVRKFLDA